MSDTNPDPTDVLAEGAGCSTQSAGCRATARAMPAGGLLSGGCCSEDGEPASGSHMGAAARRSRAAAGLIFLTAAGWLAVRRLPGDIALWPASLVPTWFGISHLVAGMTGYPGCPELGAIPSVMLGRPVGTSCEPWHRIDRWMGSPASDAARCC